MTTLFDDEKKVGRSHHIRNEPRMEQSTSRIPLSIRPFIVDAPSRVFRPQEVPQRSDQLLKHVASIIHSIPFTIIYLYRRIQLSPSPQDYIQIGSTKSRRDMLGKRFPGYPSLKKPTDSTTSERPNQWQDLLIAQGRQA